MTVYRWRGVNAIGQQKTGRADWPDLAAEVERRFKSGWRSLVVCSGEGPVPPPAIGPAGMVADQKMAAAFLTPGEVYVIAWSDVGFASTRLGLAGIETNGQGFNSVLFEPVEED